LMSACLATVTFERVWPFRLEALTPRIKDVLLFSFFEISFAL
jgi:hypothetical protein